MEKAINWIKKNYYIFAILLLAFAIRIVYFFITKNQPLWYDEADYMNMAKSWAGMYVWGTNPLRPILLALIFRLFLLINLGETTLRLLILLSSLASVFLLYKIGEILFDKRVGLIASFLLAVFWSFSFYTNRLLVDVPVAFFWLLTIYFFFSAYLGDKRPKDFILPGIFLGLSFLMKFSSVVLVLLLALYLFITEREKIFKNTKIYVFYIVSFLTILPFLVWQKVKFGSFLAFYTAASGGGNVEKAHTFLESLVNQAVFTIKLLDPFMLNQNSFYFPLVGALLIIGIVFILFYLIMLPERIMKKGSFQNKAMFLILWAVLSLLFFGWLNYGEYMDERYYFIFYPALLLFVACATDKIYSSIKKSKKLLAVLFIILLLGFVGYTNIAHTEQITKAKSTSFIELRQAGEFIRENVPEGENIIVGEGYAELLYYTERQANVDGTLDNTTDLANKINKLNANYIVMPMYYYLTLHKTQGHVEVVNLLFGDREHFTLVKSFGPPIDQGGQIPVVSIFRINRN